MSQCMSSTRSREEEKKIEKYVLKKLMTLILSVYFMLFGLWTSCSMVTVTKSKGGCSYLVG